MGYKENQESVLKMKTLRIKQAFTLIELLVIVGILLILVIITVPSFHYFQNKSALKETVQEIIIVARLARNKTLASQQNSQYGVYFDTSSFPHQYILFKGDSFSTRDSSFDNVYNIPESVEIYQIEIGGGNEIVFEKITGLLSQSGNISLRLKNDSDQTETIYVKKSGKVSTTSFEPSIDERIKDSRHVHIVYERFIDTSIEDLILTFNTTVIKEIPIADYLTDSQIDWEGEVDVSGEIQKLKIHTHRLNDPDTGDTLFSIHRDRRYNNKSLKIEISGDSSGTIIEYSADGLTTNNSSIYAQEPQWQ